MVAQCGRNCGEKLGRCVHLQHVSRCAGRERCAPQIDVVLLRYENNLGSRGDLSDLVCGIEAVEDGYPDSQQHKIGIQFRRSANGFPAITCLAYDLKSSARQQ